VLPNLPERLRDDLAAPGSKLPSAAIHTKVGFAAFPVFGSVDDVNVKVI
jgi:hypothetical protein